MLNARVSAAVNVMTATRHALLTALATLLVAGIALLGLPATMASAGTNGQQVIACHPDENLYYAVKLRGYNQNGKLVTAPLKVLAKSDVDVFCASFNGYWWKGNVSATFYIENSPKSKTVVCDVPQVQHETDWFVITSNETCFGE